MITDQALDQGGLYRLMAWLSPSFPVGAFAYSHGIECAVERGLVRDRETLAAWVEGIVCLGAGGIDAVLFRESWTAATAADWEALDHVAALGRAYRGSSETALESAVQGGAFAGTVGAAWPDDDLSRWRAKVEADGDPLAYAVTVGAAAGRQGLPLALSLAAFLHAFAANLVSAGVRLIPLGQTDGQKIIAGLEGALAVAAEAGLARSLEDIGASTPMVDWTSMRHETQYTRLFRS
ncbi:MAG: urease accessory protein UreF [Alphaproteobacteria bacterium]|nr:urease accessory protein UreF [Alphaproteobacteria bacterium]